MGGLASILYGLLSAIAWGAGDFSGGVAARRTNVYCVVIHAEWIGALGLVALALVFGEAVPSAMAMAWGAVAGIAGGVGLTALYAGLAQGRMGIVAPFSAVLAAALPVALGALTEGVPSLVTWLGFVLALAAVWLLARTDTAGFRAGDFGLPVVAGVGFGLFFIGVDRAGNEAIFWPLAAARLTALAMVLGMALFQRRRLIPPRPAVVFIVLAGLLDAGGNLFFAQAARTGRLDVAAVLASLYSATTVLLAWLFLNERVSRGQAAGLVAAFAAIALIAV